MRHLSPKSILVIALLACLAACVPGQDPPAAAPAARGATIRIATWNIENWRDHFTAAHRQGPPPSDPAEEEALRQERFQNDEDQWEIAQVLLDPDFSPDVLVFQEGASQADIEQFNKDWLAGMYETVNVFPSNDDRGQTIGILLKPGFRIVGREDQYFRTPDPQDLNPRTEFLFARGPAFALVEGPGGRRFWVGTNHQKSKGGGNDAAMTRWRNAEAAATRQIMKELVARGPAEMVFLGDMNDELGVGAYELEGGGDVIANLVGPPAEGFELATRSLSEEGQASFMGYWNTAAYRSLIDHVVVSRALADDVVQTKVHDTPWARVASDHLPVYVDLRLPAN
jgi:hypothetical protein